MKSSDKTWSTEGGKCNLLQYSGLENPMGSMKMQKDMTREEKSVTVSIVSPSICLKVMGLDAMILVI